MASMPQTVEVSMSEVSKQILITIKVKQQARFWLRMWVMSKLLLLAKWVAPVSMEIENTNDGD